MTWCCGCVSAPASTSSPQYRPTYATWLSMGRIALVHHSAICVNAVELGLVVIGLFTGRAWSSPDTPRDLRVNVVGCVWSHDASSNSVALGVPLLHSVRTPVWEVAGGGTSGGLGGAGAGRW